MDYFKLTRAFWDFSFENPERIKPNHCALYLFIVEHCNRLGWKEKFGLPTTMSKDAIGIRSYNTYINTLNDLVDFGFIIMIEKSKNQYSSNIVALSNNNKTLNKALDKAFINHATKQSESTIQSIDSINKQHTTNNKTNNKEQIENEFSLFWDKYNKKTDSKKCKEKFIKLPDNDRNKILEVVEKYVLSTPDIKFRKNPLTWLNGSCWNDEIKTVSETKEVLNPNNERIVKFNTNVNFTTRRLPESKFLEEEAKFKDGGYVYKILGYE